MATVESSQAGAPVEAVIISGPRKGQIIRLKSDDVRLTAEEERALDQMQAKLDEIVQKREKHLSHECRPGGSGGIC